MATTAEMVLTPRCASCGVVVTSERPCSCRAGGTEAFMSDEDRISVLSHGLRQIVALEHHGLDVMLEHVPEMCPYCIATSALHRGGYLGRQDR